MLPDLTHTDLTATPQRALAMSGILRIAHSLGSSAPNQLGLLDAQFYDGLVSRFRQAETYAEQSDWLEALYDNVGSDNLFYNILDDDDYDRLEAKQMTVEARWYDELTTFADDPRWASLPIEERLRQLRLFCHADINMLSQGDDTLASHLFDQAICRLDQCGCELLGSDASASTYSIPHLSTYYHLLCLLHPGKRNPAHAARYKQFFNIYSGLKPKTEDDLWQTRWIDLHYSNSPMHRADRCIQPQLAIIDEEACRAYRQQCFLWWAGLDPYDDCSIQDKHEQDEVMTRANTLIQAWLKAKRQRGIPIPPEKEATALLTRLCSASMTVSDDDFCDTIIRPAYALLPRLPESHLKTHLAVHLALYTDDSQLLAAAEPTIPTWDVPQSDPENRNLREYLAHSRKIPEAHPSF